MACQHIDILNSVTEGKEAASRTTLVNPLLQDSTTQLSNFEITHTL